jgi:hypothetical protein
MSGLFNHSECGLGSVTGTETSECPRGIPRSAETHSISAVLADQALGRSAMAGTLDHPECFLIA